MDQAWFEMREIRRKHLDGAVWIALRVSQMVASGELGHLGYRGEFWGLTSIAMPVAQRDEAKRLDWGDVGLIRSHSGGIVDGQYVPADVFHDRGLDGLYLVLEQDGNLDDPREWHLHQDLVIALGLKREGDTWIVMKEGYIDVVRLRRQERRPSVIDIRAEHLKDYLCARGMGLCVSSYHGRDEIVEDAKHITWTENPEREESEGDRWEGRRTEIHEGGVPYGSSFAVVLGGRKDISGEDIPIISPMDDNITATSWSGTHGGRKLVRLQGELWRKEWVTPAAQSPRVLRNELPPSVFFLTDNTGTRESRETLTNSGRWLWFTPGVIMALAHRRGGGLAWYTRDTGGVWASPGGRVAFGVNTLGLVVAYAKDVALLPDWVQRLWVGFNISPEGGVAAELFNAQAKGEPADTQAPEAVLPSVIESLKSIAEEKLGIRLFREHEQFAAIMARTHRFRALDRPGFFSLAKDVARLTADSIDGTALQAIVSPPKGQQWRPLKSLEKLLALKVSAEDARRIIGPLFGAYDLRLADAHLPASELADALNLAGVDQTRPFVTQGYQLLSTCVSSLYEILSILQKFT